MTCGPAAQWCRPSPNTKCSSAGPGSSMRGCGMAAACSNARGRLGRAVQRLQHAQCYCHAKSRSATNGMAVHAMQHGASRHAMPCHLTPRHAQAWLGMPCRQPPTPHPTQIADQHSQVLSSTSHAPASAHSAAARSTSSGFISVPAWACAGVESVAVTEERRLGTAHA